MSYRPGFLQRTIVLACGYLIAALAGCAKSGPDVFAEGEALLGQGKFEEAASKFELTCVSAPESDRCGVADERAAEARIKAAEKAIAEGQFTRAERLLTRALTTADDAIAQKVADRIGSDEMIQGLAYERALGRADKRAIAVAMEEIAKTQAPVAAQAKAWLDKERPGLLIAAVKAACGPAHEGSCTKAAAALKAAALTGPEVDEATALVEAEERRIYPERVKAEGLIQTFGLISSRGALMGFCNNIVSVIGVEAIVRCGDASVPEPTADVVNELRRRRIFNEATWLRAMKSIADPEIIAALEERKKAAVRECNTSGDRGDVYCSVDRVDVPKPRPAPKKDPKK